MFDINKLYNSDVVEIADIAELIYDRNGTEGGLSADDVQAIADKLLELEASLKDKDEQEYNRGYEKAVGELEEEYDGKIADMSKELEKSKDEAYDNGYDDGFEDGTEFKKKLENI